MIHASQIGFIKEHNIFDNIFMFWESIALAKYHKMNLAILHLDFEKAYNRVNWTFLRKCLSKLGFSPSWIRGIFALFSSARNRVLIAGRKGPFIQLSRSVRQGCPFAPFLFLFFAEALHMYLTAANINLQGLRLPLQEGSLLDAEFANDTGLYLDGNLENLSRVENALEIFCQGSGALINWNKSVAFWVSSEPIPSWSPSPHFKWIPKGEAVRYLGCQVGLELPPEAHLAPLMFMLGKN
jgi:hypothetical protein